MDTSSPRNGSYLVIAVGIVAVVSLITAIVSLTKANSVSKELANISALNAKMEDVDRTARKAVDDAKSVSNLVSGLRTEMQRAVGNEFARVDTDLRRIEIQTKELAAKMEGGGARPSGGSSGGSGGPAGEGGAAPGTLTETGEYVVQQGDNFGKIAAKFGVTVAEIQAANPDVQPTRIRIGQKIRVPKKQ